MAEREPRRGFGLFGALVAAHVAGNPDPEADARRREALRRHEGAGSVRLAYREPPDAPGLYLREADDRMARLNIALAANNASALSGAASSRKRPKGTLPTVASLTGAERGLPPTLPQLSWPVVWAASPMPSRLDRAEA